MAGHELELDSEGTTEERAVVNEAGTAVELDECTGVRSGVVGINPPAPAELGGVPSGVFGTADNCEGVGVCENSGGRGSSQCYCVLRTAYCVL